MSKQHHYKAEIKWSGNRGKGTSGYKDYGRSHTIKIEGKVDIHASSDPAFQGDSAKHNPEDLFVVSISQCHMLWYLHLCADAGVIVVDYTDNVTGILEEDAVNGGRFISVTLHPKVVVTESSMIEKANALHHDANKKCFMSNSVNFPVIHDPKCVVL